MADILRFTRRGLAAAALAALASACANEGEFPSLARRAVESEDPLAEPVRTTPVVAPDAALRARAAELLAQARRGDGAFEAAFRTAAAASHGSGAAGSEGWVAAQQAISRAEAARAPTTGALGELDRLLVERSNLPTNAEDFAVIQSALDAVARIAANQQERLEGLRAGLRR